MAAVFKVEKHKPLEKDKIDKYMKKARKSKHALQICHKTPLFGDGGDIYIYYLKDANDIDWRADGGNWKCDGKRLLRGQPLYARYYYYAKVGENEISKDYKKQVTLRDVYDPKYPYAIIHYFGNKNVMVPIPHGNRKRDDKPFTMTTPSTRTIIKEKVKTQSPRKVYKEVTETIASQFEQSIDLDDYDSHMTPRDLKQVQNANYALKKSLRVKEDEIFALSELGVQEFSDSILRVAILQEFFAIFGHPAAIKLANRLLAKSAKDGTLPQVISYDTTFSIGHYYLSPLVMRNTELETNPIFPVVFLLHERKYEDTHLIHWAHHVVTRLKVTESLENVCIVTDREKAIVNAIRLSLPNANIVYCGNHILQDVRRFVQRKTNSLMETTRYTDSVRRLILCESENDFDNKLEEYYKHWNKTFTEYFNKYILDDLKNHTCKFYTQQFAAFDNDAFATNNIAESLNALVKKEKEWADMTADAIFLTLYKFQRAVIHEFNRGYRQRGKYVIKSEFLGEKLKLRLEGVKPTPIEDIIKRIKQNVLKTPSLKNWPTYRISQISIANLIIENNLITMDAGLNLFNVQSPFKKTFQCVYWLNEKLQCSCCSTGKCSHILAVESILHVTSDADNRKYEFTKMLRNKYHERKGGKKQPRKHDTVKFNEIDSDKEDPYENSQSENSDSETEIYSDFDDHLEERFFSTSTPSKKRKHLFESEYFREKPKYIPENDKYCISNIPDEENKIPFPGMRTLRINEWISSFIIVDVIKELIVSLNLNPKILLIDNHTVAQVALGVKASDAIIQTFGRVRAFNYEILLCVIGTSPVFGHHWMLGVIAFKQRICILLDSLDTEDDSYRQVAMTNLRNIVQLAASFAQYKIDFDEWEFIVSTDCKKQDNGTDCGLFVCLNAYSILRQEKYYYVSSETGRKWMKFVASQVAVQPIFEYEYYEPLGNREVSLVYNFYVSTVTDLEENVSLTYSNTNEKTYELLERRQHDWTICESDHCSWNDSHSDQQILCVMCRRWLHYSCTSVNDTAKYHKCVDCLD